MMLALSGCLVTAYVKPTLMPLCGRAVDDRGRTLMPMSGCAHGQRWSNATSTASGPSLPAATPRTVRGDHVVDGLGGSGGAHRSTWLFSPRRNGVGARLESEYFIPPMDIRFWGDRECAYNRKPGHCVSSGS